jgi:hypothetical protein
MRNRYASFCYTAPKICDFAPRRMTAVQNLERCAAWGLWRIIFVWAED